MSSKIEDDYLRAEDDLEVVHEETSALKGTMRELFRYD